MAATLRTQDAGDTQDAAPLALEPGDIMASDREPPACMRGVASSSAEACDHDPVELGGGAKGGHGGPASS